MSAGIILSYMARTVDKAKALTALRMKTDAQMALGRLLSELSSAGIEAYLVGGVVRDALLGLSELQEVDLAVRVSAIDCQRHLQKQGIRTIETGLKHGTITALVDGQSFELTSFRTLGGLQKHGESIEEDLSARDFTVNAIAYCPRSQKLIDPTNGIEDLKNGVLRTPADPHSIFGEDPLRVMRMARFVATFGFVIEKDTLLAAIELAPRICDVSIERIREEFSHIVVGTHFPQAFIHLSQIQFFEKYLPEVEIAKGFEQNEFHIHDVYEHTLWVMNRTAPVLSLRLAALFHDLGKPSSLTISDDGRRHFYRHELLSADICQKRMLEFSYPKQLVKHVTKLVRYHMRPLDCGPSGARRILRDLDTSYDEWLALKQADSPPIFSDEENKVLLNSFLKLIHKVKNQGEFLKLSIDGEDLKKIGFQEGKELGAVLRELKELVLESPEKNEPLLLLEYAKRKLL